MDFPMLDNTPAVAIDLDGTLAEYEGWRGDDHIGNPRKNAIWALNCFKQNGWEVEIFTNRHKTKPIWQWLEKWAPGLVDRINETRATRKDEEPTVKGHKPKVDLFIDDRSWETFGEELDWVTVIQRLDSKGMFPRGLVPMKDSTQGDGNDRGN